jgi:serine/threonine-protein kinase RsbT
MAVLAVSELATNLVRYALHGRIALSTISGPSGDGIQIESLDDGPGIADLALAMTDGFSTGASFGSGLPATRRLVDEFEITSNPDGTRILARKWKKRR